MKFTFKALLMTMIFLVVSVCFVSAKTTAEKPTTMEMVSNDISIPSATLSILNSQELEVYNFTLSKAPLCRESIEVETTFNNFEYQVCVVTQKYKQVAYTTNRNYSAQHSNPNTVCRKGIGLTKQTCSHPVSWQITVYNGLTGNTSRICKCEYEPDPNG